MPDLSTLPRPARINVAALGAAVVAIVVQIAAGVDYPPVPPGPIILGATACLVTFNPRRWTFTLAVAVPLFLAVGGTIAFLADEEMALRKPDEAVAFAATAAQMVALLVAVIFGVQARRRAAR